MSLQKFKLLATHCSTVAESPTRSPVIHIRRRKTLRLLLTRSSDRWRLHDSPEIQNNGDELKKSDKRGKIRARRKLRELFVSSPPYEEIGCGGDKVGKKMEMEMEMEMERDVPVNGVKNNGGFGEEITAARSMGFSGSVRPMSSVTLRCRLLRRTWRPVLVTIPEQ